jgi:nucleotide-binding universal stress UspA family protein
MKPRQEDVLEEFAREFIRGHRDAPPPWPVERILVATDFSLCSLNALGHGEELARKLDAEILLLHVEAVPIAGSEMANVTHAAAEGQLTRTAEQLRNHHLSVRTLVRTGAADEEILNIADTERASLIVMGTHGRKGVARVLLGSVAERVLRSAPCPVLTVGPRKDG